jgi:hypothetical protein
MLLGDVAKDIIQQFTMVLAFQTTPDHLQPLPLIIQAAGEICGVNYVVTKKKTLVSLQLMQDLSKTNPSFGRKEKSSLNSSELMM